MDQQMKSNYKE